MLNFEIQNYKSRREMVYEEIKKKILTGRILPGTRLMEIELADTLGVSRTPIREAIRKLEKEGLVTIEPRKGAYASQVSTEDMVAILEVRQNMEGLAAYFAASRISSGELENLKDAFERYNQAVKENNTKDMIKYDTAFHRTIVEASHNKILVQIIDQLQELVLRFRYIYYDDLKRAEKIPKEHGNIVDAIIKGNGEAARTAADAHIDQMRELVIKENVSAISPQKTHLGLRTPFE
ncbi:MAG: GntR family transcriptional regulator [Clostridiales bacterium]|nr:GntR family transcriptional regulator [Clostridiales bacterium]